MTETASVSWNCRALRRAAWSLGAAVVLAAVGPAIANAAGAHVRNPVTIALNAFGTDHPQDCSAEPEPTATPTESVSAEPTAAPTESPAAETSVEPTAVPTESVSAEPTVVPTEVPTCVEASPTASVSPSAEAPESEAPESEAPEAENADGHGEVVSTVAHCAPKGRDPLLDVEGAPANHGAFVKAAAHGESLVTPWGTFDLSAQAGADALCAAVDAARAALPPEPAKTHGKPAKEHGHGHGKDHAKHAKDGAGDEDAD